MKNFLRIASGVNIMPLLIALQRQPELWGQHQMRTEQPDSPHVGIPDIWLRYNKLGADLGEMSNEHDSVWYPAYYHLPEVRSIIFSLMAMVEGERLGGVLITKVPQGGRIAPHVDGGWHVNYYEKFYLSIKNPPKCRFFCEDEVITPESGEIWWFDNRKEHWVENNGDDDRITLIICIRTHRFGDRHDL